MLKRKLTVLVITVVLLGGFLGVASGEQGGNALYKYASALYENECFVPAIVRFNEVINTYPDSKHVQESKYLIGECLQREKKYWKAMKHWEKVRDEYPGTDTEKKCEEAIQMVKRITEVNNFTDKEEFLRYPVTIKDMVTQTCIDNIVEHESMMVISDMPNKPEIARGVAWCDKILSELKDSPIAVNAYDKRGWIDFLKNSPSDSKKAIEHYLKTLDAFPEDYQWVLRNIKWSAMIASDPLYIGDLKYGEELYRKLIEESRKRIGKVSFYESFAKTQLRIMGKDVE